MRANRATSRGGGVWDQAHRSLTVGLLLTISITAFEAMAVATVLPEVAVDLGRGDLGWYGWVFSGFMLANLVGIPAAAAMAGRGGPARPFVVGSALFTVGLAVSGLAASMPWLVAGRLVQGFGAGALSSVAYSGVAREYDAAGQARMLSLLTSAWVVPGLLGPAAAAALAAAFGWRSVFLALLPLTVVAAVLAVSGLHAPTSERRADGAKSQEARGDGAATSLVPALRLAAGSALAMTAMGLSSLLLSIVGVVAGAAIGIPALRAMLPEGTLVAKRGAPAALAAKALVTIAFFGAEAFLPLSLTAVRGESIAMAGLALTAGTLTWTGGAWLQETLGPRAGRERLLGAGLLLVALSMVGAASVVAAPHPVAVAVASWGAAGLGIGVAYSATTLAVFELTPKGDEGAAGAAVQLANVLGTALGTGIGAALWSLGGSLGWQSSATIAVIDAAMLAAVLAALAASTRIGSTGAGSTKPGSV